MLRALLESSKEGGTGGGPSRSLKKKDLSFSLEGSVAGKGVR